MLTRRVKVQLAVFTVVAIIFAGVMIFGYMKLPAQLFGVGRYTVTLQLPETGGLYKNANVTYRGTEVGRVQSVDLTPTGVVARLSLNSGVAIPADVRAEVHSQSAVGEQYVALLPRSGDGPSLADGALIPAADATVPPDINALLDATNTGLQAIPRENLQTVIDESHTAIGGLGAEIARFVRGSTTLAIDAQANLDSLTALIEQAQPVLDSQADTADSIDAWASHVATVTDELRTSDSAVSGILTNGGPAAAEAQQLIDRIQPTVPVLLSNLVSLGQIAVTYQPAVEQLLVLLPQGVAALQAGVIANLGTKQDFKGAFLSFNLNLNNPTTCATGFLPAQQMRTPASVDSPERPAGDIYCRIPQDADRNVRGARNLPCLTVPGKRAPTVKMCESDQPYVPLNDGYNWKGDPNATLSGQGVPQLPENTPMVPAAQPLPPVAVAEYDPATGSYLGPDGKLYTQADLAHTAPKDKTWQSMLTPPASP
ncbi:mammalian cell entry protein [Mycobacterium sp. Root265]|uniref:MCE family protein n=1 Tax=Mycobacterium sp. Root265 TaxID=1736504 RepID=UPI00070C7640|nr:MlaD family protein [Mycobacterium sp. Root265]KRD05723.1 mammalian cell entry protein [Mycobacterium sp. Root265]